MRLSGRPRWQRSSVSSRWLMPRSRPRSRCECLPEGPWPCGSCGIGWAGRTGRDGCCSDNVCSLQGSPPCVWPTRSSRLTARRRKRSCRTWKGRSESRQRGWAWAWYPEGEAQLWGVAGKCHCSGKHCRSCQQFGALSLVCLNRWLCLLS